jgi:hypothetical protein
VVFVIFASAFSASAFFGDRDVAPAALAAAAIFIVHGNTTVPPFQPARRRHFDPGPKVQSMQSQRHRTVIPGNLGPKEKIVSNFSFPTGVLGAATTKSHHAKQNGPDLAGGIGVEARTCSLGKSGPT